MRGELRHLQPDQRRGVPRTTGGPKRRGAGPGPAGERSKITTKPRERRRTARSCAVSGCCRGRGDFLAGELRRGLLDAGGATVRGDLAEQADLAHDPSAIGPGVVTSTACRSAERAPPVLVEDGDADVAHDRPRMSGVRGELAAVAAGSVRALVVVGGEVAVERIVEGQLVIEQVGQRGPDIDHGSFCRSGSTAQRGAGHLVSSRRDLHWAVRRGASCHSTKFPTAISRANAATNTAQARPVQRRPVPPRWRARPPPIAPRARAASSPAGGRARTVQQPVELTGPSGHRRPAGPGEQASPKPMGAPISSRAAEDHQEHQQRHGRGASASAPVLRRVRAVRVGQGFSWGRSVLAPGD